MSTYNDKNVIVCISLLLKLGSANLAQQLLNPFHVKKNMSLLINMSVLFVMQKREFPIRKSSPHYKNVTDMMLPDLVEDFRDALLYLDTLIA